LLSENYELHDLTIKPKKLGKKSKRQDNSLDYMTKKFIKYVYNSDSDKINLNNAIEVIKINKRRIYDITNVFEGKKYK
jgi:transcription factor E2F3